MDSLILGNRAYSKDGEDILPTSTWHLPEGGLQVGLYRLAADSRKNQNVRNAAGAAAREIETAALALLDQCFVENPPMRDLLRQHQESYRRTGADVSPLTTDEQG